MDQTDIDEIERERSEYLRLIAQGMSVRERLEKLPVRSDEQNQELVQALSVLATAQGNLSVVDDRIAAAKYAMKPRGRP
jgi:hypothetical protein